MFRIFAEGLRQYASLQPSGLGPAEQYIQATPATDGMTLPYLATYGMEHTQLDGWRFLNVLGPPIAIPGRDGWYRKSDNVTWTNTSGAPVTILSWIFAIAAFPGSARWLLGATNDDTPMTISAGGTITPVLRIGLYTDYPTL